MSHQTTNNHSTTNNIRHGKAIIKLNLRGKIFATYKETLLKHKNTYFDNMISSDLWAPDLDGAYFIDRRYEGFERILEYLHSNVLHIQNLSEYEEECIYDNLDYFQIPYSKWNYTNKYELDGIFTSCQLGDGQLCGIIHNTIHIWNMNNLTISLSLIGHLSSIRKVIILQNGYLATCSEDTTIKIWDISNGTCILTLTEHTSSICSIIQLSNGTLCSSSTDKTMKIWNIHTGICEDTIINTMTIESLTQLYDGRICGGDLKTIKIWGFHRKESLDDYDEKSGLFSTKIRHFLSKTLEGHNNLVVSLVTMDSTRICSGSYDETIKVWNTYTGECERTLIGHTHTVLRVIRLFDGRLCSGSIDSTIKIWNIETGECEKTLISGSPVLSVFQLNDGRILSSSRSVIVWS